MDTTIVTITAENHATHVFDIPSLMLQQCLSEIKQVANKYKTLPSLAELLPTTTQEFTELINEVNPPSDNEYEEKTLSPPLRTTTTTTVTTYLQTQATTTNNDNNTLGNITGTKQSLRLKLDSWNTIPSKIRTFIKKPFENTISEQNI